MSLLRVSTPVLHAEATGRVKVTFPHTFNLWSSFSLPHLCPVYSRRSYYSGSIRATVNTLLNTGQTVKFTIPVIYFLHLCTTQPEINSTCI